MLAHAGGFDENLYLDAATRTFVEETGGANLVFITKDGKFVTPSSPTILPSITRRSLAYVAGRCLGMAVEERRVPFDEVASFAECGLCGTAAVLSPVGKISGAGKEISFASGWQEDCVLTKLRETLTGDSDGRGGKRPRAGFSKSDNMYRKAHPFEKFHHLHNAPTAPKNSCHLRKV